jgi:catechol 2,3-dioxygenase-like lactoylglutathione lyase family enzyme
MIHVRRLGHASFETPDLARAIDYYTSTAGLFVAEREKDRAYLVTGLGQLAVELVSGSESRCSKLSFEMPADTDLADCARELTKHGVASDLLSSAVPGMPKVLSFQDPKGTTIELFADWSFLPVAAASGVIAPLKLGHLAFVVPDPKPLVKFYTEVLGFRISDWIEDFFVFLRCNADHHVVNFIQGSKVMMHHVAFELQDFSRIQGACELLGQKRIPIAWGPVRLGPGHNVAIFHRNPDDQMIELYVELDQMKEEGLGYFEPRPWHRDRPQRPKVWPRSDNYIWGPPPTPDFLRARG